MAEERIKSRPDQIRDQLLQAAAAITAAGPAWPGEAPTALDCTTQANAIGASIIAIDGSVNDANIRRQQRAGEIGTGRNTMKKIDGITTGLYGADGAQKADFGLTPITPGDPLGPPLKITDLRLADGTLPASIFADCETIEGNASYDWEWYSDAGLTVRVGNVSTTPSQIEINGLTTSQRYWIRVRALRGGQYGQWSDPDSRVANV